MKTCPNCEASFEDSFVFCSYCGTRLTPPPAEESAPPAEPVPDAPPAQESAPPAEPVPDAPPAEESAPPAEALRPEKEDEPPEPKDKPGRRKAAVGLGRRILAVLLSLLLFLLLLAPALGFAARRGTTEEGLTAILEDINPASLRAALFFDDVDDPELTLSEALSEDLGALGLKIGDSSVAKVLNSSALKSWLAGEGAALCADIYRGRTRHEFDPQALKTELLAGKTARVLEKERISLSAAEADKVLSLLERYGAGDMLSRDTLKAAQPALVRTLNFCLSYVLIGVLLALSLGLMVLIFRVNRWRADLSFSAIGVTILAVGALLSLSGLLAQLFPGLWERLCGGQTLPALLSRGLLFHNLPISFILLGAGVLLAVLGRLLRGKKEQRA